MTAAPDLLVVGAGPAGLATAIAGRRAGLSVQVVERQRRGALDKPCGEGLMPDGLAALAALGVDLDGVGRPFHGIRYLDGDRVAEGRFSASSGRGVRRTALHGALLARAEATGVEIEWGTRVETVGDDGVAATTAGERRGGTVVVADGLRSPLRAAARLGEPSRAAPRFGVRRHCRVAPWSDCVEVWWADGAEAYVTPVADDEVGIAILWSRRKAGFDELLALFPALAARLDGAEVTSRDRGTGPLRQPTKAVVRGRLALVGDAAGYVDAITGEGLSLAFHQATALVDSLVAGDLARYPPAVRRLAALPDAMTKLLIVVEARPWLRRRVVGALARDPALFSTLLAIHARERPPASLGLSGVLRLIAGLLRA